MTVEKPGSLTRSIDLNYPTNRAIVIITLIFLSGVSGFQLFLERDLSTAFYSGLRAGTSVFFAWAFARELDPDNELSAFFAAFLGCTGFLLFPFPLLLALFLELLLLRIVNRSSGVSSKTSDSFAVFLLSSWLSLGESWIFGLFTALVFFFGRCPPCTFSPKPYFRTGSLNGFNICLLTGCRRGRNFPGNAIRIIHTDNCSPFYSHSPQLPGNKINRGQNRNSSGSSSGAGSSADSSAEFIFVYSFKGMGRSRKSHAFMGSNSGRFPLRIFKNAIQKIKEGSSAGLPGRNLRNRQNRILRPGNLNHQFQYLCLHFSSQFSPYLLNFL